MPLPSGQERERHEALHTLVDSKPFEIFFYIAFKPEIDDLKHDLCFNTAMSEADRLGKQYALRFLERGFERVFKKAGAELPAWVAKEFGAKDE